MKLQSHFVTKGHRILLVNPLDAPYIIGQPRLRVSTLAILLNSAFDWILYQSSKSIQCHEFVHLCICLFIWSLTPLKWRNLMRWHLDDSPLKGGLKAVKHYLNQRLHSKTNYYWHSNFPDSPEKKCLRCRSLAEVIISPVFKGYKCIVSQPPVWKKVIQRIQYDIP